MGFYGRRMVPEPLLKLLKKLDDAGVTDEDLAALAGLAEELGDKASLTEDNTFTGENTFNDTTNFETRAIFNSGAQVNDDVYFTDFSLIENEDTDKDLQETLDEKQDILYCHNIYVSGTGGTVCFQLINSNDTPFTIATLISYLQTISDGKDLNIIANGRVYNNVFDYNGSICFISVSNGYLNEVDYNFIDNGDIDHTAQSLSDLINSNCIITDGVVELS